jgi:hypothetical protein
LSACGHYTPFRAINPPKSCGAGDKIFIFFVFFSFFW